MARLQHLPAFAPGIDPVRVTAIPGVLRLAGQKLLLAPFALGLYLSSASTVERKGRSSVPFGPTASARYKWAQSSPPIQGSPSLKHARQNDRFRVPSARVMLCIQRPSLSFGSSFPVVELPPKKRISSFIRSESEKGHAAKSPYPRWCFQWGGGDR